MRHHLTSNLFHAAPSGVTWRYLWPVLAVALVLRIALAQTHIQYVHPDQVFQYLEPAYRLVHGYGLVTWEWIYGIRSWFIPVGVAGVIWNADALGVPHEPVVETAFALISMTIPLGAYRLAQAYVPEPQAIAAFLIGCFWGYFLHYGPTPMTSMLASSALIWVAVLMTRPATTRRLLLIGALSALTLAVRYQLLPVVGALHVCAIVALGRRYDWCFIGAAGVVIAVGLIDLVTWGSFLGSYTTNFELNFNEGLSELFGTHPITHYLLVGGIDTGGILIAMVVGLVALGRTAWPIWVAVLIGVAAFHVPAHKEVRFLTWVMPFGAVGFAHLTFLLADRFTGVMRHAILGFMAFWVSVASLVYLLFQYEIFYDRRYAIDTTGIMRALRVEDDPSYVVGVSPHFAWWRTSGYYTLSGPVPISFENQRFGAPPDLAAASHLVTERDAKPEGFERVVEIGHLALWRATAPRAAISNPPSLIMDPGFLDQIKAAPAPNPVPPLPAALK